MLMATWLRSVKACLEISAMRNVWAAASRAIVQWKWRLFGRGQRWFHPGERKAGLSPACLNTECDACAHARGRKQLLLSSIFLFLLFSVVVVGFSSFQTWEMLGQVKKMDFGGCKLLSPVVRVVLDTESPRKGSIVSWQLHVSRQNRQECHWRIKLPSNPLESLCTASCAAVATVEWKIFTAVIRYRRAASR